MATFEKLIEKLKYHLQNRYDKDNTASTVEQFNAVLQKLLSLGLERHFLLGFIANAYSHSEVTKLDLWQYLKILKRVSFAIKLTTNWLESLFVKFDEVIQLNEIKSCLSTRFFGLSAPIDWDSRIDLTDQAENLWLLKEGLALTIL